MQLFDDHAFVLETRDLSDSDRVVVLFTREHGTKQGAARGAKRRFSRFAGQLQPLSLVKVQWSEKPERQLVRIRSLELVRSAQPLLEELEGILLACYLAETVAVFAADSDADPVLFRLVDSTVQALLDGVAADLAARYFEVWVLRLAGIFPPPTNCPNCFQPIVDRAVLPPTSESLLCPDCTSSATGLTIGPSPLDLLRAIHRRPLLELAQAAPATTDLRRIETLCAAIRRAFLQQELRSYRVMLECVQ